MPGGRLELADVIEAYGEEFLKSRSVSHAETAVLRDIVSCRTAACGGHIYQCTGCGSVIEQSYNSCCNRHCSKCQGSRAADWVEAREREILPVPYFHVVFTLPRQLNSLARQNPKLVYELLFRASKRTLLQLAERRLGVKLGFFAVLHTWGQKLELHPHIHCIIPAVGICLKNGQPQKLNAKYLIPDKILSTVFRAKFIEYLKRAKNRAELNLPSLQLHLNDQRELEYFLGGLCSKDWVVYTKRHSRGGRAMIRYLARYTHRVAIANSRLLSLEQGRVTFRYIDYANGARAKSLRLDALEFIRRFLLHVLPKGFIRIRHCGFMAGSEKEKILKWAQTTLADNNKKPRRQCPDCGCLEFTIVFLTPQQISTSPVGFDTS